MFTEADWMSGRQYALDLPVNASAVLAGGLSFNALGVQVPPTWDASRIDAAVMSDLVRLLLQWKPDDNAVDVAISHDWLHRWRPVRTLSARTLEVGVSHLHRHGFFKIDGSWGLARTIRGEAGQRVLNVLKTHLATVTDDDGSGTRANQRRGAADQPRVASIA
eukprot:3547798-Prymnesium_polylepis.2